MSFEQVAWMGIACGVAMLLALLILYLSSKNDHKE